MKIKHFIILITALLLFSDVFAQGTRRRDEVTVRDGWVLYKIKPADINALYYKGKPLQVTEVDFRLGKVDWLLSTDGRPDARVTSGCTPGSYAQDLKFPDLTVMSTVLIVGDYKTEVCSRGSLNGNYTASQKRSNVKVMVNDMYYADNRGEIELWLKF